MSPHRGRPPGGGPPTRFTSAESFTGTPTWLVDDQQNAAEVAAAFAQQSLIARIRQIRGKDFSAADVARHLGRAPDDRTVADVWAGRRAIGLPMLLALALAFDVTPLPHLDPDDLVSLLPAEHHGWLGTWRPGKGLPVFTPAFRPGGEPSWHRAAVHLSTWLTTTSKTAALHLANDEVATHVTAKALADAGLHTGLASVTSAGRGLHYESQPEIDISVVFLSDHVGSSRRELIELLQRLLDLRMKACGRALSVLLIEPRLLQRLDVLLPGCADADTGDTVRVPSSTLHEIVQLDPGSFPPEFEMTLLASERSPTAHATYIYEIAKAESVSTTPP